MNKPKESGLQQRDKEVVKNFTSDDVRKRLRDCHTTFEPDEVLKNAGVVLAGEKYAVTDLDEKEKKYLDEAMMMLGHEKHYLVAESITDERWRPMVMDLASCIQKEFTCVTSNEIALAGLAASAYYRSLRASRKMGEILEKDSFGMIGVQLIAQVGKEIDRAYRQYVAAIETLSNQRRPQINVKVQTRAAFIGNQTINAEIPVNQYENNDLQ